MLNPHVLYQDFVRWLREDCPFWDVTSSLVGSRRTRAVVISKGEGVAAGISIMAEVLRMFGIDAKPLVEEGEDISRGDKVMLLEGPADRILGVERVLLNVLNHMCGIASATREAVRRARAVNPNVKIAATRKTLPGLRALEKYAVLIGGGETHRFSLSDMVLIKDNHIRLLGGVERAVSLAKKLASPYRKIEVEVGTLEDAVKAAELGADIIMLDNMRPEEVRRVLEELERRGLRDRVVVEASGGITLDNVQEYASTGVDVISMGFLTHSAKSCDMSLEVVA